MLASSNATYWVTWFPGALLATFGVLVILWKVIAWLTSTVEAVKRVQEAMPTIDAIHHQFSPNNGSSMRDQLDGIRVEQRLVATKLVASTESMSKHIADDAKAFARQDRVNQRVESSLDRIEDHVRKG